MAAVGLCSQNEGNQWERRVFTVASVQHEKQQIKGVIEWDGEGGKHLIAGTWRGDVPCTPKHARVLAC